MRLFAHGPLRQGGFWHDAYLAGRWRRVEKAFLPGAWLYRLTDSDHAALVLDPAAPGVKGELFEAPDDLLSALDYLEGHVPGDPERSLCARGEFVVRGEDGERPAWVWHMPKERFARFADRAARQDEGEWPVGESLRPAPGTDVSNEEE